MDLNSVVYTENVVRSFLRYQLTAYPFADPRLDFLVFDEAHTFTGAMGAETAGLIRRLPAFCNVDPGHTTCVATSATIVDHRSMFQFRHSREPGIGETGLLNAPARTPLLLDTPAPATHNECCVGATAPGFPTAAPMCTGMNS